MASTLTKLKLSLLLSLLLASVSSFAKVPPTCNRIECPSYDVIHEGDGYEIRGYNSTVWASTSAIQDISLVEATRTGFLRSIGSLGLTKFRADLTADTLFMFYRLFDYIQGKNNYKQKIEMTAPVITEVSPSDGPFCESSFVVSFFVPKKNQADPPPAKGLHVRRLKPVYVAVRQFGGFVRDSNVGEEAAALKASLAGTEWASAIDKSHRAGHASVYAVAQYNDPLDYADRVNEIWFLFDLKNGRHAT